MNNAAVNQTDYPKNTWQLIKYIAKRIPGRLLKALPMTIAMGLLFWLLHTFLLVYTNEGFNPDTWLGKNILNVSGRLLSSTLLWMMVGAIVPMIISFFRRKQSPAKLVKSMVSMLGEIIGINKKSGGKFLPIMCFSCATALLIEALLSGVAGAVLGGIVMSSVVAFLTGRGSIFIQVLRMVFQDVQLFILKKQKLGLDGNNVMMIVGVSGVTLFIVGLLKTLFTNSYIIMIILSWLWVVAAILGVILVLTKNNVPKQFMLIFGFLGLTAVFSALSVIGVYADDGGWVEAGGTFSSWISSEGAGQAIFQGLPPTIGGLVGSYVSSILGGLFEGFTMPPVDIPAVPVEPVTPGAGTGAVLPQTVRRHLRRRTLPTKQIARRKRSGSARPTRTHRESSSVSASKSLRSRRLSGKRRSRT
jgi:hypothetical protein